MQQGDFSDLAGYHSHTFYEFRNTELNEVFLEIHSAESLPVERKDFLNLHVECLEINTALFSHQGIGQDDIKTLVVLQNGNLRVSCSCKALSNKLCYYQSKALYNIHKVPALTVFFDSDLRRSMLKKFAEPYGLEKEPHLEDYFLLTHDGNSTTIRPKSASLIPVTRELKMKLSDQFSARDQRQSPPPVEPDNFFLLLVFKRHKYYKHLNIELMQGQKTMNGKFKNPLSPVDALKKVWHAETPAQAAFFHAVNLFHEKTVHSNADWAMDALSAILKNPCQLPFFMHHPEVSENITAASLNDFNLGDSVTDIPLQVVKKGIFFEISASLDLNGSSHKLDDTVLTCDYFLYTGTHRHPVSNLSLLNLIKFFKAHDNKLLIHQSKYKEFQESILNKAEEKVAVSYSFLPPASKKQLQEHRLDQPAERLLYLADSDPYVELNPVMKYGDIEIPILSKKQIRPNGIKTDFQVNRDTPAEIEFTALLLRQHPYFQEQLDDSFPFFYLHKKHFLNEEWFLNAFEEWQNRGITILGFNKLKQNKINPNKAKISVKVLSGVDWFNAEIKLKYGNKRVKLQQIKKALRNKSKYIHLDDGSLGILPHKWLQKFSSYFNSGEIEDDMLRISKTNFCTIGELFESEFLDLDVKTEIDYLNSKLDNFASIQKVPVPGELNGHLREYQKQGLNWLNFLDDFNFGGILADDMGLGKSLQIIAFVLSQRTKRQQNTNLLVVPTSLVFNWQREIEKFASSLKTFTLYGSRRPSDVDFETFELVITTYGTLLTDIRFLKNHKFNYVFLDESQNIKNPDSQRYRAACLLQSRNRIVLTGTPVENNTFDLYGQLSFACPGLLGNKQYFKEIYAIPIDQFKDKTRAAELQHKIAPFILRRTKSQVASELPEKTEMVLFCEMSEEQRNIYDAYEREFRDYICSKTNEELPKSSVHVLRGLTRLRQICNSPLLLNDDEIGATRSGKIDVLLDQIVSKAPDHKILVFSQFVSMLDLIKRELSALGVGFSYLTGSTGNRGQVVKEFQSQPAKRVFLISMNAGGTGLNLTEADYVYMVDPWWNPAVENQAIDRIYRIGQTKKVMAVRLICQDSIEEKIAALQEAKKDLSDSLVKTDHGFIKSLTKERLLEFLQQF